MKKDKTVLVVTYYFPPSGGGGINRIHNFVKYLSRFGFCPLVLTVRDKYYENTYTPTGLLDEYPKEVRIYRTNSFETGGTGSFKRKIYGVKAKSAVDKIFFSVIHNEITRKLSRDRALLWLPYAVLRGVKIFRKKGFDIIFSTSPPFGNNIIAYLVHKITKKPFILDYRDEWVGNEFYCPKSNHLQFAIEKRLEHILLKEASKVVSVTQESISLFREKYPDIEDNKYEYLPNGYDPEYFKEDYKGRRDSDKIHFVYTGSLTERRNPEFFLTAVRELVEENNFLKDKIKIIFIGFTHYKYKELVDSLGLKENVSFMENQSPKGVARFLQEKTDVCLLFQRGTEGGKTAIPGKLYESMASKKPILCMDDNGATTKFLKKLGVNQDLICDYKDIEKIKNAVCRLMSDYNEIASKFLWKENMLSKFNRIRHTEILSEVLQDSIRSNQ